MAIMYPNLLQVVVLKKSGITDIEQIKGKKISSGSPGSGTNFMSETVFKALGIPLDSYSDSRLSFTETANALRDGTIDVGFWSVGPGTSSILDLATTHDIHIISFTAAQQEKIQAANQEYSAVDLAGGVYRGVDNTDPDHRCLERDDLPKVAGHGPGLQPGESPLRTSGLFAQNSSFGLLYDSGKCRKIFTHPVASGDPQIYERKGYLRAGSALAVGETS